MYKCVGCNQKISWDGIGIFSYTCQCGGHAFINEETKHLSLPTSVMLALHDHRELPHLDYIIGVSDYTSKIKDSLIDQMKSEGAVWMKDCKKCLTDGTYQRELDDQLYFEKQRAMAEVNRILRGG